MEERIFAGLIQIKAMMSVLERRDFQPARDQTRNQLGDQRGFAGTAPARETDNTHGPLYSKTPGRKGRLLTPRVASRVPINQGLSSRLGQLSCCVCCNLFPFNSNDFQPRSAAPRDMNATWNRADVRISNQRLTKDSWKRSKLSLCGSLFRGNGHDN